MELPQMIMGWRRQPRPLSAGSQFSHPSDGVENSFPLYLPRVLEGSGATGLITDVREATIPLSPGPSGPNAARRVPICPPHPPRPGSSSAARPNVNTQGKLQGKHTADKNLMLYVTKQNEYLIRAFMRNHITNRPHAAARTAPPLPAGGAPRPAAKQLSCWQQAAPNKHSANSVGKALIRKAIIIGVIALNYPPNRERRSEPGTQLPPPSPAPCARGPALCCPLAAAARRAGLASESRRANPDAGAPPGGRAVVLTCGRAERTLKLILGLSPRPSVFLPPDF